MSRALKVGLCIAAFLRRLCVLAFVACATSSAPSAPPSLRVDPLGAITRLAAFGAAPGDTLAYVLSWTAGARATGYQVTVRSSSLGWTGLPAAQAVTTLSANVKAINLAAWDTNTFTAVVRSTNARGLSKDSAFVTWVVARGPGKPGPVIVDSSGALVSIMIRPSAVTVAASSAACRALPDSARFADTALAPTPDCVSSTGVWQVQQFCGFLKMLDGKYRMDAAQGAKRYCRAQYDSLPLAEQLPGYPLSTRRISPHQWASAAR